MFLETEWRVVEEFDGRERVLEFAVLELREIFFALELAVCLCATEGILGVGSDNAAAADFAFNVLIFDSVALDDFGFRGPAAIIASTSLSGSTSILSLSCSI